MDRKRILRWSIAFALIASAVCMSCKNESKESQPPIDKKAVVTEATKPAALDPKTVITGPNAREICVRPKTISSDPQTIEDVIALLNKMPKPVTVPCLLDVLERPLHVNVTSNRFSGQPANGAKSPRIFLFVGQSLILSVVPTGDSSEIVEFGYKTDADHSIKGELKFPVSADLTSDAAYTFILSKDNKTTLCSGCHFPEEEPPAGFATNAIVSRFVRPFNEYNVPLTTLETLNSQCKTKKSDECALIQSIFAQGKVLPKDF